MSDAFWTALFVSVPPTITALAGLLYVISKMNVIHHDINGKFSELLEVAKVSSELKGKLDAMTDASKTTVITDRRTKE